MSGDVAPSRDDEVTEPHRLHRTNIPSVVEPFDEIDIDEEHIPELSSYISEWIFWWKFAVWPIALWLVNGIVFASLVVYDEYEFLQRQERAREKEDADGTTRPTDNNTYLSMLRYNSTIFAVVLSLDACLLFIAAKIVQKQVVALHDLQSAAATDPDSSSHPSTDSLLNRHHIHAQVSQKLDVILGRGSRSKSSILVSLLLLGSVTCAAFAFVSIVEWSFSWTPAAQKSCLPYSGGYKSGTLPPQNGKESTAGIPRALQTWAKSNSESEAWTAPGPGGPLSLSVLQLFDGTTYMAVKEPPPPPTSSKNYHEPVLAAIPANGTIQFFWDALYPTSFLVLSNNTDTLQRVPAFCCLYKVLKKPNPDVYLYMLTLMCADPSDSVTLQSQKVVRNVTLDYYNEEAYIRHHRSADVSLEFASIRWYENYVWIMLSWGLRTRDFVEYFKVKVERDEPLQLISVGNRTKRFYPGFNEMDSYDMIGGETLSCEEWRWYIQTAALMAILIPAAYWLTHVRKLSVGVVPAYGSLAALLACFSKKLAAALGVAVATAAAFALLGGNGAAAWVMYSGSEEVVWLLYASMMATSNVATYRPDHFVGYGLLAFAIVGSVLGHPALFLVGWIGGIGLVLVGIFYAIVRHSLKGLVMVGVGTIGGAGCVVLGKLLIKYRSFTRYYCKRGFDALRARTRSVAPSSVPEPTGRPDEGLTLTDSLLPSRD